MHRAQTDARAEQDADRGATAAAAPPQLTPEAIQFAHRMFDAARHGDDVLLQAVDAGLPVNMTNDEGESLPLSLISILTPLILC